MIGSNTFKKISRHRGQFNFPIKNYSGCMSIMSVYICEPGTFGDQKRVLDLLKLELQIIVSCHEEAGPLEEQPVFFPLSYLCSLLVPPFLAPLKMHVLSQSKQSLI